MFSVKQVSSIFISCVEIGVYGLELYKELYADADSTMLVLDDIAVLGKEDLVT